MRYSELSAMPPFPMGEQLPLDRISPRPSLQRSGPPASLDALAESIRRCGLMRPVIVRRTGMGRYVVVSGNRRLKACRMLGMSCISVRILADDARWQPADRLLEALLMRRMHYLEEADALQALHEHHGMPWEEVAAALCCSQTLLREQARLISLPDELQALLLEEGAPLGIALLLLRLKNEKNRMDTAYRIVTERLCIRDAALLVAAEQRKEKRTPISETKVKEVMKRATQENGVEKRVCGRRFISVIRDQRLYINTIRDIAGQLQAAGYRATVAERQTCGGLEITICIPKRRRRAAKYQSM